MELKNIENYFPQGIAMGNAFLGRAQQIKWLTQNIQSNHHTLLLAPRRYGKTSLVINTLNKLKLPYSELDLHLAVSSKSVEKKILSATTDLLQKISAKNEQLLSLVQGYFKTRKVKWSIGFKGILGVELEPEQDDPPENILFALNLIDHVLGKKNKKAVIFLDEFQEIHDIEGGRQLQGAIRHFAQSSKNLVLIFSGSNRKMLIHMFDDKSQPMYELCDRILLDRIKPETYKKYINQVAMKTWSKPLSDEVVDEITLISECHPKRAYNLCYYLWRSHSDNKKLPDKQSVVDVWKSFVEQRLKDVRYNLSNHSHGQLKVLTLIACGGDLELTSKKSQNLIGMAGSSIMKALTKLEQNDFVEKNKEGKYQIIDPLISYILKHYEKDKLG